MLPIEVLKKASKRRTRDDVIDWCGHIDEKGLERLRAIHLEALDAWKPQEMLERNAFRPYLGEHEADFGPQRHHRIPSKVSVAAGLSILKRSLLVAESVAIADPLTRVIHRTSRRTAGYCHPGLNELQSVVSRLYEIWPAISDGAVEIVEPEAADLARKEQLTQTEERLFFLKALSKQEPIANSIYYRHRDLVPEALMHRMLFSAWTGAYDPFVFLPQDEYSIETSAYATKAALHAAAKALGYKVDLPLSTPGVATPRMTLRNLTNLSLPNLDDADVGQLLRLRNDKATWLAIRSGIEEAFTKAELSISKGNASIDGAMSLAEEVAGEANRMTDRLTATLSPPALVRRVGRASYRVGIALVAPATAIALGAGPASWVGAGVGLTAAAVGLAAEEKKDRKSRVLKADLETFRTLLSGEEHSNPS